MLRRVLVASLSVALLAGCDSATSGDGGVSGKGSAGAGGSGGVTGGESGSGGSAGTGTGGSSGGGAGATGGKAGSGGTGGESGGSAGTGATAGGGDSGSGGSAGTGLAGGGSAGTSTGDPCDGALFCDDFESYTSGQAPNGMWAARTDAGAVTIDTAEKVSGSQSVKFTTMGSGSGDGAMIRLMDASVFPVSGNAYYGRMMFRLESAPTASVHWTIIAGGGVVPNDTYHAVYRYGGQHPVLQSSQLMANYETPDWYSDKQTPGSDCWKHATGEVIPTGTFVCVEWQFDGPANGMHLWLDGRAIDGASVDGTGEGCVNAAADFEWTAPTFATLDLGWEAYQPDDPRTAWIDDVVISTTRVGCP